MHQPSDNQTETCQYHPDSGFTLIEKLIAVAVFGIMGAIAAPNFQALLDRRKVEQAVTEIRGALEETQRRAVRDNKLCELTLDLDVSEVYGDCLISGARTLPEAVDLATNLIDLGDTSEAEASTEAPKISTASDLNTGLAIRPNENAPKIALAPTSSPNNEESKAGMVLYIVSKSEKEKCKPGHEGHKHCTTATEAIPVQFGTLGNAEFDIATNAAGGIPVDPTGKIVLYLPHRPNIQKQCVAISNTLGLTRMGIYTGELDPSDITDSGVCKASNWEEQ